MSTKAIEQFLQTAYTDERLAMLLAHAEDGRLAFFSCCCFAGIPRSSHALRGHNVDEENDHWDNDFTDEESMASVAFCNLARNDKERQAKLIPIIKAEIARRESLAMRNEPANTWDSERTEEMASVLTK